MKRQVFIGIFSFLIAIIMSASAVSAKDKKGVILSTIDIDEEYEILGIVSHRSSELDPKEIHAALVRQAEKMGADYVLGILYYSHAGYLYGSGTAVKLIKNDE